MTPPAKTLPARTRRASAAPAAKHAGASLATSLARQLQAFATSVLGGVGTATDMALATQHSLASSFLAPWLARLPLRRDDLLVRATADNLHDCVRELEEGSVDLLICYTQPELPLHLDPKRYLSLHLADDALVPYSKPDAQGRPLHPLLPAATGPVAQLRYGEGTFLARATALAVQRSDLAMRLHPVVESALAEALRACAVAGLGVAWLPRSLVVDDLERGVLARAAGPEHELVLQTRLYGERSLVQGRLKGLWRAAGALAEAGLT